MAICLKEHRKGASRFTVPLTHGLPPALIQADKSVACAEDQVKDSSNLEKQKQKPLPSKTEKQNQKTHQLTAGALPLVRSRSQQSPVTVRLAETRCAREQEQGQVEQLEEARIAEARMYHRSWPEVSQCLVPREIL